MIRVSDIEAEVQNRSHEDPQDVRREILKRLEANPLPKDATEMERVMRSNVLRHLRQKLGMLSAGWAS